MCFTIVPYSVLGIPFGVTGCSLVTSTETKIHLSVPQSGSAALSLEAKMLISRNIIGVRTGAPIIGVNYNALKNWVVIATSNRIYDEGLVNDALLDSVSWLTDEELLYEDYTEDGYLWLIGDWKKRCALQGVDYLSEEEFSFLLPRSLNFPPGGN